MSARDVWLGVPEEDTSKRSTRPGHSPGGGRTARRCSNVPESRPIPTPWNVQWNRFRYQLLPVLTVLACAGASTWLWQWTGAGTHMIAEVEAVQVDVAADQDGILAELPGNEVMEE